MNEQLPGFVLAELYGKSLVITEDKEQSKSIQNKKQKQEKKYLGDYKKKIAVIINDAENIFLDDESLNFLSRILAPCKLNLADIALINFDKQQTNFSQLKKEMQPEFLLLFDVTALEIELPFIMPDYKVQNYDNCSILIAPSLQQLNKNSEEAKAEKTKLWKSLQTMFNLK